MEKKLAQLLHFPASRNFNVWKHAPPSKNAPWVRPSLAPDPRRVGNEAVLLQNPLRHFEHRHFVLRHTFVNPLCPRLVHIFHKRDDAMLKLSGSEARDCCFVRAWLAVLPHQEPAVNPTFP